MAFWMRRSREFQGAWMHRYSVAVAALAALTLVGQATVAAAPKDRPQRQCFRTLEIDSSVQATETQLNLRTRDNRYFQIQTKGACFTTLGMDPYVMNVRGSDLICEPIDIDLSAGPRGFQTPCFVDKIVPMTKAQMMALPKRQQP